MTYRNYLPAFVKHYSIDPVPLSINASSQLSQRRAEKILSADASFSRSLQKKYMRFSSVFNIMTRYIVMSVVVVFHAFMREAQSSISDDFVVEIISPAISHVASSSSLPITGPAIDMGVEDIQKTYSKFFKVKLTYLMSPSVFSCDDAAAEFDHLVSDYYYRTRVPANLTVLTYPGCYKDAVAVAKLGAGWNELVLVGSYNDHTWRNKALYPNLIQAGSGMVRIILLLTQALVEKYGWKTVHLICDKGGPAGPGSLIGSQVMTAQLRATPGFVAYLSIVDTTKNETFAAAIRDIKSTARIVMFAGHANSLRKFMIEAHRNNMTNGEYVYITQTPFDYPTPLYGNLTWQNNDEWDEIAFAAYRSLFVVIPSSSSEEVKQTRESLFPELIRRSKQKYNYTYKPGDVPTPIVLALYACQHLLGVVINETLAEGNGSVSTAEQSGGLAKRFWNRTIPTPIGPMSFDEVGERRTQLEIQQMNSTTGRFEAFLVQNSVTFELLEVKPLVWFSGTLPRHIPECGFTGQTGPCGLAAEKGRRITIAVAFGVIGGVAVFLIITMQIGRKLAAGAQLKSIKFELEGPLNFDRNVVSSNPRAAESNVHEALYNDHLVSVTVCCIPDQSQQKLPPENRDFLLCAKAAMGIVHPNVARFFGIELTKDCALFVHERCKRGNLKLFLANPQITIDWDLKSGLAVDLLRAVRAVNAQIPMRYHGLISCSTCVIDNHFTLKLTDFGVPCMMKCGFGGGGLTAANPFDQFHMAPEISSADDFAVTTTKSNLYSAGTVIWEIVTEHIVDKHSTDFSESYTYGNPAATRTEEQNLEKAIRQCMEVDTQTRGSLDALLRLFQAGRGKQTVVEKIIRTLSKYADDLEYAVALRTHDLLVERDKCDALLQHMLPLTVVEKLRRHEPVYPEIFDSVTLQFSDITGFMNFVTAVRPFEVVDFLDKSHGLFDETISTFDVYKVETISDSYFVASGLPKRIGDRHASEMCRVAISLMTAFKKNFSMSNMQLRIGIHSGSCVAAVAGSQRPRYCVFGDTVNTTSRMESHGEGSKVHLSSTTAVLLNETCADLRYVLRGPVHIKGKGLMETFWLVVTSDD